MCHRIGHSQPQRNTRFQYRAQYNRESRKALDFSKTCLRRNFAQGKGGISTLESAKLYVGIQWAFPGAKGAIIRIPPSAHHIKKITLNCPKLVQAYVRSKARKPAQAGAYSAGGTASPWAMTIPLNLLALDGSVRHDGAGIPMDCIAGKFSRNFSFVPCETYSVADMSNITRGFLHRDTLSLASHLGWTLGIKGTT